MPRCDGPPNLDCPTPKLAVKFSQGDMFLCETCENIRFPRPPPKEKVKSSLSKSVSSVTRHSAGTDTKTTTGKEIRDTEVSAEKSKIAITQYVLAYMVDGLNTGAPANVLSAVMQAFTLEEVCDAKKVLFEKCACYNDIIGDYRNRQTTNTRSNKQAHAEDIIKAIQLLDNNDSMPQITIAASDLHNIPRSKPEELNNISLVDRVNEMESVLNDMKLFIDSLSAANERISEDKSRMEDEMTSMQIKMDQLCAENAAIKDELAVCIKSTTSEMTDAEAAVISSFLPNADATTANHIDNITSKENNSPVLTYAQKLTVELPAKNEKNPKKIPDNRKTNVSNETKIRNKTAKNPESKNTSTTNKSVSPKQDEVSPKQDDGFKVYTPRRSRNKRLIIGTKVTEKIRGAPEASRSIFVRVHSSTNQEDLKDFIEGEGFDVRALECISHKDAKSKSYRLDIPKSQHKRAFDASIWPKEVSVKPFYRPRSSQKA